MATTLERLTAIETTQLHQGNQIDDIEGKVTALYTHFLENKGRAAQRKEFAGARQSLVVVISAVAGACAGGMTAAAAIVNRYSPVLDALPK